jgi:hypothetical protein
MSTNELKVVQKVYDLIKWYVPILNRLPRDHKFILGDRMIRCLYDLLEGLLDARFSSDNLNKLQALNLKLDILRYQTRLLHDFVLISTERYEYVSRLLQEIGAELGAWIKHKKQQESKKV